MEKKLGKILDVKFGLGGYQDSMLGIWFTLGTDGWGVGDGRGFWDPELIDRSKNTEWSEKERDENFSKIMRYTSKLLKEAKVGSIEKLKNKPIEVTFDGNVLKEWRILSEVI